MYWFKCGLIILPSCYILSLCSQVTYETSTLDISLVLLYIASAAIAGKIIYDRYQQINILGSLTTNPHVTSFANKTASFSASSMLLGFLGHLILYAFKIDSYGITAINIFVCAFGTLYMWMQGIVTIYATTLFYDKNLTALRQCLATISSLVLVIMAVLGTIATLLPRGPTAANVAYACLYITSLCSYVLAAIFCTFILSFEKDYKYIAEGLPSDLLLDDGCSYNDVTFPETDSLFTAQELQSSTIIIKGTINSMKIS